MTQLLLYRLYMIQKLVFLKILSCSCGPDDFLGFTLRLYFSVCVLSICAQDTTPGIFLTEEQYRKGQTRTHILIRNGRRKFYLRACKGGSKESNERSMTLPKNGRCMRGGQKYRGMRMLFSAGIRRKGSPVESTDGQTDTIPLLPSG